MNFFPRNKLGLQVYALRFPLPKGPLPKMPGNWFFANVHVREGSFQRPRILYLPDRYIGTNMPALHDYNFRDRNMHISLVRQKQDGSYVVGIKLTHDSENEFLEKENKLIGAIGQDKKDSYLNAHTEYVLDKQLSQVTDIRNILGKENQLTPQQLQTIKNIINDSDRMLFDVAYEHQYKGPNNLSGTVPKTTKTVEKSQIKSVKSGPNNENLKNSERNINKPLSSDKNDID